MKQTEHDRAIQRRQAYRQRRTDLRHATLLRGFLNYEFIAILRAFPNKNALHVMAAALLEIR